MENVLKNIEITIGEDDLIVGRCGPPGRYGILLAAEERIRTLDPYDSDNNFEKLPFLKAVVIVCRAMVLYAKRHAELARKLAEKETRQERKRELLEIAVICEKVPGDPAESFHEAIQSQWFTQVGFRFEQMHD